MFEVTESHGGSWLPFERQRMFPGEREFDFTPADSQMLAVRTTRLGVTRLCRVVSSGHRIALEEPQNGTVIMPRAGAIEVETEGRTLRAGVGETLVFPPNRRRTLVIPGPAGHFAADCVLLAIPQRGPSGGRGAGAGPRPCGGRP